MGSKSEPHFYLFLTVFSDDRHESCSNNILCMLFIPALFAAFSSHNIDHNASPEIPSDKNRSRMFILCYPVLERALPVHKTSYGNISNYLK